jgi:hypothetical protein
MNTNVSYLQGFRGSQHGILDSKANFFGIISPQLSHLKFSWFISLSSKLHMGHLGIIQGYIKEIYQFLPSKHPLIGEKRINQQKQWYLEVNYDSRDKSLIGPISSIQRINQPHLGWKNSIYNERHY